MKYKITIETAEVSSSTHERILKQLQALGLVLVEDTTVISNSKIAPVGIGGSQCYAKKCKYNREKIKWQNLFQMQTWT